MGELWTESAGTRLFAMERGAGEPWVFLHGGMADHRAATLHTSQLDGRVVLPDQRGAGRSHFHGELSWELLGDDVIAWLDALGVERAVVGGVSMGAASAWMAARRHPERVRALVLVHPAYGLGLNAAQRAAMAAMDAAGRRAAEEGVGALFPLFDALPDAIRERARAMVARFDARSVAATTRFLATNVGPFSTREELAAVDVPTWVVPGEDPTHPPEVAALYAATMPRCEVVGSLAEVPR